MDQNPEVRKRVRDPVWVEILADDSKRKDYWAFAGIANDSRCLPPPSQDTTRGSRRVALGNTGNIVNFDWVEVNNGATNGAETEEQLDKYRKMKWKVAHGNHLEETIVNDMYAARSYFGNLRIITIPVGSSVDTDGFLIAPKGNKDVNNDDYYEAADIPDDADAGHENTHTGAEQHEQQAQDEIEPVVCSNCERVGHSVSECIKTDQNGWVWGCGICNSEVHNTEYCPSLATLSPDQKWKELFRVFVTLRAGFPPLVAEHWDWCREAAKDDAPELAQYPFTCEQSHQWWTKNQDLWRFYDYWEAPDLRVQPEVTSKAQLQGNRNFSCKYKSRRERKERVRHARQQRNRR